MNRNSKYDRSCQAYCNASSSEMQTMLQDMTAEECSRILLKAAKQKADRQNRMKSGILTGISGMLGMSLRRAFDVLTRKKIVANLRVRT